MKRTIAAILVCLLALMALVPALAETPEIEKTEYKGSGKVEVDFRQDVQYKKASVTVKDASGKKYTAKIKKKDDDDLTFQVKDIKAGTEYTYTIKGVRSGRAGEYVSVSGTFATPEKAKLSITKVDYDREDQEIDIDFSHKVQYKNLKVTVKDAAGKKYKTKIKSKDSDDVDVRVAGLTPGETYTVTVSGVRLKGTGKYGKVSATFVAVDN